MIANIFQPLRILVGMCALALCLACASGCNLEVTPARTAEGMSQVAPGPEVPREEEDARLAWFEAEHHILPENAKDFDAAVTLFQQRHFAEAKALFDKVSGTAVKSPEPSAGPAEAESAPNRVPYRISPGDTLSIDVAGWNDLGRTVTVRSDGMISVRMIGEVEAAGKTGPELSKDIAAKLSAYLKEPRVTVFSESAKPNMAAIMGAVQRPGEYPVTGDTRLWNFIAGAGGLIVAGATEEGTADLRGSYLVRSGKVVPVDFERLFLRGDARHNVIVHPGDVIYVPAIRATISEVVTVLGAVQKPGNIRYRAGMKLAEVVAEAGGIFIGSADVTNIDIADYTSAFLVRQNRMLPVDFRRLLVDGDMSQNVEIKAGDFISIPTSRDNRIYVLGEVGFPREIVYASDVSFVRALAAAGGLTLDGRRGAVYHVTGSLVSPKVRQVNAFAILEGREPDFILARNDIIYVSPTPLTELSHVMTQVIPCLTAAQQWRGFQHGYR